MNQTEYGEKGKRPRYILGVVDDIFIYKRARITFDIYIYTHTHIERAKITFEIGTLFLTVIVKGNKTLDSNKLYAA